MELKSLRNFLTVAELGNITYAAESLMLSQPALSTQMKALEKELGRQLFIRHSRHLELTPEGRLLRERAERIVEMSDKTLAEFRALD